MLACLQRRQNPPPQHPVCASKTLDPPQVLGRKCKLTTQGSGGGRVFSSPPAEWESPLFWFLKRFEKAWKNLEFDFPGLDKYGKEEHTKILGFLGFILLSTHYVFFSLCSSFVYIYFTSWCSLFIHCVISCFFSLTFSCLLFFIFSVLPSFCNTAFFLSLLPSFPPSFFMSLHLSLLSCAPSLALLSFLPSFILTLLSIFPCIIISFTVSFHPSFLQFLFFQVSYLKWHTVKIHVMNSYWTLVFHISQET